MTKDVLLIETQKSPVQAGKSNQGFWGIHFVDKKYKEKDHLVGWVSSNSTAFQVNLSFNTKEEALKYIKENNLNVLSTHEAPKIIQQNRTYADNFS